MNPNLEAGIQQMEKEYDREQRVLSACRIRDYILALSLEESGPDDIPSRDWDLHPKRRKKFLEALDVPEEYQDMIISAALRVEKNKRSDNRECRLFFTWGAGRGNSTEVMIFGCDETSSIEKTFKIGSAVGFAPATIESEAMADIKVIFDAFTGDEDRWQRTLVESRNVENRTDDR